MSAAALAALAGSTPAHAIPSCTQATPCLPQNSSFVTNVPAGEQVWFNFYGTGSGFPFFVGNNSSALDAGGIYSSVNGTGVLGETTGTTHLGAGVRGVHHSTMGASPGVLGTTNSTADQASGVMGEANAAAAGSFAAGVRAHNHATNNQGVGLWASHDGAGLGIYSTSVSGIGAEGLHVQGTGTAAGVKGWTASSTNLAPGVFGEAPNGTQTIGVLGNAGGYGVLGVGGAAGLLGYSATGLAGLFVGNVHVEGTLSKSAGSFRIDHPLDPTRKYLQHSFVESPDMKNVYDGVVRTDRRGLATIRLPRYFGALNRDFRYQLTVVGRSFARAIVWSEIAKNRFVVKTDQPRVKVSWQVTGIRKDAYANAHRIQPEIDKPAVDAAASLRRALRR
jgi:hypothetical protein